MGTTIPMTIGPAAAPKSEIALKESMIGLFEHGKIKSFRHVRWSNVVNRFLIQKMDYFTVFHHENAKGQKHEKRFVIRANH